MHQNYLLSYTDDVNLTRIYAIFSEKLGNFILEKHCKINDCNCLGCGLFKGEITTFDGEFFPILDIENVKEIKKNLIGYYFTEYGNLLVESLKPGKYKKYGGTIKKVELDELFKQPVAFIKVVTENDGSFTHYYIDPDKGKKKISTGCYSGSCQCIACRLLNATYMDFDGIVKNVIGTQKSRVDLDDNLFLPIYYGKELIIGFLSNYTDVQSEFLIDNFDSPLERFFYKLACLDLNIQPQHQVGKYRIDFSIPDKMIAIELDGHEFHKTVKQRTHDAQRDRWLLTQGWIVLRFTGTEIFRYPDKCIDEICKYIGIERLSKINFEDF